LGARTTLGRLKRLDELAETLGVAADVHQVAQGLIVERGVQVQARADDVVPLRLLARSAVAKDVCVVNLLNLQMALAGGCPEPAHAAAGAHFVDGRGEQLKEWKPG